jgi:general secretion pathway protein E
MEDSEVSGEDVELLRDLASDAPIIQAINGIITKAIAVGASDIHIEPSDREIIVRIRLDGILMEIDRFPIAKAPALLSRIKIMADLDIAERRLAQDGRFNFSSRGVEVDTRVSIIPSLRGEGAVLRLLERRNVTLEFGALGMPQPVVASLEHLLMAKQGMILITGPTGSGKTTSLYAAMKQLNAAERKIISVEDPVEYRVDGVTQIQVNPKIDMGFGNALRSILRHDPDVLIIGEMRDSETAEFSVQSALTGHLVLSTLHTNNAATAITRLLDQGVEPYLITSTCLGVLGQRLVRRICPACKEPALPSEEVKEKLVQITDMPLDQVQFSHGRGCEKCLGTGYSGRIGIYEFLTIDDTIRSMVLAQEDAHKIHRYGVEAGMISMWADGMNKVARGETTYEELVRVIGGDDYAEL